MERRKTSYTVGMYIGIDTMENSMEDKIIKIELPYAPEIPLWGIYPEKNMFQNDTCTLMFIAALFTRTKMWK